MTWADARQDADGQQNVFAGDVATLGPVRGPDEPLEQRHRNLASSLQARLEEVYLGMLRKLAKADRDEVGMPCRRGGFQLRG